MLYPVLGLLEAKGGWWDAEMEGPNVGKSPERGSVCPPRSQNSPILLKARREGRSARTQAR